MSTASGARHRRPEDVGDVVGVVAPKGHDAPEVLVRPHEVHSHDPLRDPSLSAIAGGRAPGPVARRGRVGGSLLPDGGAGGGVVGVGGHMDE